MRNQKEIIFIGTKRVRRRYGKIGNDARKSLVKILCAVHATWTLKSYMQAVQLFHFKFSSILQWLNRCICPHISSIHFTRAEFNSHNSMLVWSISLASTVESITNQKTLLGSSGLRHQEIFRIFSQRSSRSWEVHKLLLQGNVLKIILCKFNSLS